MYWQATTRIPLSGRRGTAYTSTSPSLFALRQASLESPSQLSSTPSGATSVLCRDSGLVPGTLRQLYRGGFQLETVTHEPLLAGPARPIAMLEPCHPQLVCVHVARKDWRRGLGEVLDSGVCVGPGPRSSCSMLLSVSLC